MRSSEEPAIRLGRRVRRRLAAGVAIAAAALLLGASEARADSYIVAQCGWRIGADAGWEGSAGSGKFRPGSHCVAAEGSDPFAGVHIGSLTRPGGGAVSGTRFARWRWIAPPGTGIVSARGKWWGALHDGFEHRLGTGGAGGFAVFTSAERTDAVPSAFAAGFPRRRRTFESRLLCARPQQSHCDLRPASSASLRSLQLTLADDSAPRPRAGGALVAHGWRRGTQDAQVVAADTGSGVRFAETLIDGARIARSGQTCSERKVGGGWVATRMRPCELRWTASHTVRTARLSDGRHRLRACAIDFAGNRNCADPRPFLADNTAPAAPHALALQGGGGWRRSNDFAAAWDNPRQRPGSPIAGVAYRLTGPGGRYDSGILRREERGIESLGGLAVPAAGSYSLAIWLRDEAGNESASNAATATLLFDDVAPTVAFRHRDRAHPERIAAIVADQHSGPAGGEIAFRRVGTRGWRRLPTSLRRSPRHPTERELVARFPSERIRPGRYRFRAGALDAAGNRAATTRGGDGRAMVLHAPLKGRSFLRARLRLGGRSGRRLKVPYGAHATLAGRLRRRDGTGLAGRRLRIAVRPVPGSPADPAVLHARTGARGRFHLRLAAGPSRRCRVSFGGGPALARSRSPRLRLRVRSGIGLSVSPDSLRTGEALELRGRVRSRGALIPSRGKLVVIQYLEREGRRWQPALITRAGPEGRFLARYRFRYVSGLARIELRAMAPPEEGWPYAAGASAPVRVTVRG
jgi:hypothetical protein